MGESKQLEQLNNIISKIMISTKEDLPSLKDFTKKCLEPMNSLLNALEDSKEKDKKEKLPTQANPGQLLSNYFIRQLRLKYQVEIDKNIKNEQKLISIGKLMCEFIFWLIKETKLINLNQSLKFLQDIVETYPLSGLEELFNLISESLKKIDKNTLIKEGRLDVLLMQNLFLKRININLNSKLRGKICLLFCDIFSITDKSGTNSKGKYSQNIIDDELSNFSNDNSDVTVKNEEDNKMDIDDIKKENNINKNKEKTNEEKKKEEAKMEIEEDAKKEDSKKDEKNIGNDYDLKEKEREREKILEMINEKKEENEKTKLYKQFWKIEKILINPFIVRKKL